MFFFAPIEAWATGYLEGEDAGFAVGGLWVAGNVFAPVATVVYQYSYPSSDITKGGWGGYDPFTAVNLPLNLVTRDTPPDPDDSTYAYSPINPTTEQFEIRLFPAGDPGVNTNHVITLRFQAMNQDTNFDIDLVQNTTVLDSWTENVTAAAGVVERSRTLSGTVADSITQYGDLRIRGIARA